MIDKLIQSFIVDAGMDELKSLDEAFRELGFERLEDRNFFKDVNSRVRAKARREAAGAIALLKTIVAMSPVRK